MSKNQEHNKKHLSPEELFRLLDEMPVSSDQRPAGEEELDAFDQEALEGFAELDNKEQAKALHEDILQRIDASFLEVPKPAEKIPVRYFRLVASLVLLFTLGTVLFFWLKPEVPQMADNDRKRQEVAPAPLAPQTEGQDSVKTTADPTPAAPKMTAAPTTYDDIMMSENMVSEGNAAPVVEPAPVAEAAVPDEVVEYRQAEKEVVVKDQYDQNPSWTSAKEDANGKFKENLKLQKSVADSTVGVVTFAPNVTLTPNGSTNDYSPATNSFGYNFTIQPTSPNNMPSSVIERKSFSAPAVNNNNLYSIPLNENDLLIANKKVVRRKAKAQDSGASAAPPAQKNTQKPSPAKVPATAAPALAGADMVTVQKTEAEELTSTPSIRQPVFANDTITPEAWLQKQIGNDPRFSSVQRVVIELHIAPDGRVSQVKFLKNYTDCAYCSTRASDLLRTMPAWKPSRNADNQRVPGLYRFSFRFQQ